MDEHTLSAAAGTFNRRRDDLASEHDARRASKRALSAPRDAVPTDEVTGAARRAGSRKERRPKTDGQRATAKERRPVAASAAREAALASLLRRGRPRSRGLLASAPTCYVHAMPGWKLVDKPARIPTPDGKVIEEIFGRVSTGDGRLSVAHMIAPPRWSEPAQTPEFGELTVMVRGRLQIEVGRGELEVIELLAGQAFWVEPGVRVRYSNVWDEEAEYYAVCLPAFGPELAHREE